MLERIEAKREMERQKRMYEEKCISLQSALEKQKNAYMELKKKEEVQKEVERIMKKKQKEEEINNVSRQQTPFNPSAPLAESSITHQQPQLLPYQSQNVLQHASPTFQISNHQSNSNPPQPPFQDNVCPPSLSHLANPATPMSQFSIPQSALNFKPLVPKDRLTQSSQISGLQSRPLSFSSQTSDPQTSSASTQSSNPEHTPQRSAPQDTSQRYVPKETPQRFVPPDSPQRSVPEHTSQRYVPQYTPKSSVSQDTSQRTIPKETPQRDTPQRSVFEDPSQRSVFELTPQRSVPHRKLPNQSPTLSPSDTTSLHSQNLYNEINVPIPMSSNQMSRDNRTRSPYSGVKNDVKNEIKNLNYPRLYPNLEQKSSSGRKKSSLVFVNDDENSNHSSLSHPCDENSHVSNNNQVKRTEFRNKNKKGQTGRSDSKPRRNPKEKEEDDFRKCRSCKKIFGLRIYQCTEGHSSCHECKESGLYCGECSSPIDKRNFPLEDYLSAFERPCPNADEGCIRQYKAADMEDHLKQCPFKDIHCPLRDIFGTCSWNGKFSKIRQHFDENHPENQKEVDTEVIISDLHTERYKLQLATIGPYTFLVHTKVANEQIYMAIQLFGTQSTALNWVYEFHVYNKSAPRQKYVYSDSCISVKIDIQEIFEKYKCACIPISYAQNFVNNQGYFTYKFYIKKQVKTGFNKKNDDQKKVWKRKQCNDENDFEFL